MSCRTKTRDQVIKELKTLRSRVAELERSEAELRRSRDKLEESETKCRQIFENIKEGICIVQDGQLKFCNERVRAFVGRPESDPGSIPFTKLVHPEDRRMVLENYQRRTTGEQAPRVYSFRIKIKKQPIRWLEASVTPTTWEQRPAVLAMLTDITRRKEMETRLRAIKEKHALEEARFKTLVETAGAGVAIVDLKGKFTFVNKALCRMMGYREEDLAGKPFARFLHPEERKRLLDLFRQTFTKPSGRLDLEFRVLHRDGRTLHMCSSPTVFRYKGKILGFFAVITDITELKLTEEALKRREIEFRTLADNAPVIISRFDRKLRHLFVNKLVESSTGIPRDRFIGKTNEDLGMPEDLCKVWRSRLKQVFSTGKGLAYEFEFPTPHGKQCFESRLAPEFDGNGVVDSVLGISTDVTERVLAEQALHESDKRYRTLFEKSIEGIGVSRGNKVISANRALLKIFGYRSLKEFLHVPLLDLVEPEYRPMIGDRIRKRQAGQDLPPRYEYSIVRKDGKRRRLEISTSLISIANEKYVLGTFRDITKQKRMVELLKENRANLQALINNTDDCIVSWDLDGRLMVFNNAFAKMIDRLYNRKIKPGVKLSDYQPEHVQRSNAIIFRRVEAGKRMKDSFQKDFGEGDIHTLERHLNPIRKGKLIIGTAAFTRDITDKIRMDEELKESREKLRNLAAYLQAVHEKERTRIAAQIHDDLAQTLTALKFDLGWLKNRIPTEQTAWREKIESGLGLIDQTIERAQMIYMDLRPSILDDLGLSSAIKWHVAEFIRSTGLPCGVKITAEEPCLDKDRTTALFRILQEALNNIARHAGATRVSVSLTEKPDEIELIVRDNGKGITLQQLTNPRSFGLIGIQERAKSFGGTDRITGIPGRGTTVRISLPK